MLAGFYLLALIQLGVAVALALGLANVLNGLIALKVTLPLFSATVGAAVMAVWRAIRDKREPPRGLSVRPDEAPDLWAAVHQLARKVRTRAPDEIRLIPDINAAVVEQARLLGLVGGRRFLYIGLPLLQTMTVAQLRSVLAHELGHYSRRHTRLGEVAYRGRLAMAETLSRIGPRNPVGWVFGAYATLYVLVDNLAARRQEYEADQASVRAAGRAVAASALRELPVLDAAWGFYFQQYVMPGWEAGYAPADLFGGFSELVAARQEELDEVRSREPRRAASKWDTHPPLADRIAAIAAAPERSVRLDERSASALVPDLTGVGLRLQELMLDVGDRTVLPWPQFIHAMMTMESQRQADQILRAVAQQTGLTEVSLETVLRLIAAGRLAELAESFFPDATSREAGPLFVQVLEPLLQLAAVRSGQADWRLSWSGPAELITRQGYPLSFEDLANLAVSPGGLHEAYRRMADMGIDVTTASWVERAATAVGVTVLAALSNIKVNEVEHDLLVLDRGMVFIADPGGIARAKDRLHQLVESAPAAELAEQHLFLPYENVASAKVTKRLPVLASLTLKNGHEVAIQEKWASQLMTKNSRDVLLERLQSIAPAQKPAGHIR
jgi:Zn-dependent protease with chaperone function